MTYTNKYTQNRVEGQVAFSESFILFFSGFKFLVLKNLKTSEFDPGSE